MIFTSQARDKLFSQFTLNRRKSKKEIHFQSNGVLTLGVEIELQLIEPLNLNLVSCAEEVLIAAKHLKKVKPELNLSTIEINTDICRTVQEAMKDLKENIAALLQATEKMNLLFASTGSHPYANYIDCIISSMDRYQKLLMSHQWLTRRMTVYGLHVHLGMANGDECIRYNNFFTYFLPHFLAISSSSPYWQGIDTGLAACRPTTYESLPTAGQPYFVNSWRNFEYLYESLENSGSINSYKDLWWDLRPSPTFGTLEIRICDSPATLYEVAAIIALIHTLAHWFADHGRRWVAIDDSLSWISRENKWRAIRYGLNAELILDAEGKTNSLLNDLNDWLVRLEPFAKILGYQEYFEGIHKLIERGTSSERQRRVFYQTNSFKEVVKHNINEFLEQSPRW